MGAIHVLDISVANLIAAGEVVDRPASVVKELLENSIDAQSTIITVEIKRGGVAFIRITDNGCGMHRDDVPVAIKRHATSKIKDADDLDSIMTLGFRGEALAAIASVATVRIMTKRKEDQEGTYLVANYGTIEEYGRATPGDGTTVIVEELFYNVPARRKFLKSDMAESMAVNAVVEKIALSHPEISIRFVVDNNIKFSTSGDGKLKNTIYAVLGRDFAKRLVPVHHQTDGIFIEGYVGAPDQVRSNRNYENFFINGRYIKSRTAMAALEQAFHSYTPSDKFPCCVLNIGIHPAFVDVNVHPTKLEVKFSNEHMVFDAVYAAVRSALLQKIDTPQLHMVTSITGEDVRNSKAFVPLYDKMSKDAPDEEILKQLRIEDMEKQNVVSSASVTENVGGFFPDYEKKESAVTSYDKKTAMEEVNISFGGERDLVTGSKGIDFCNFDVLGSGLHLAEEKSKQDSSMSVTEDEKAGLRAPLEPQRKCVPVPQYQILGVAFQSYVFLEVGEKILVIDKHAAHERILFEKMKDNLALSIPDFQILFVPIIISGDGQLLAVAKDHKEEIFKLGFCYQVLFGENKIVVTEIPGSLSQEQAKDFLTELLSGMHDGTKNLAVSKQILYEKALYQASCKAAVKAGRRDSIEHIEWLCQELLSLPDIKFCPHGRPVAFELTKKELEHQFKRT